VLLLYGKVLGHTFVSFDDGVYVADNPVVLEGLHRDGVRWAFSTFHAANWHPLTWLSHMLDVELFGAQPGPQHLAGAALHALNAALLFLALRLLTGAMWPCATVAALFAVHPLRVESVAWIAERKDVLAGTFWMLALIAWAAYARRPGPGRYALVFGALAASLMAKPMAVTLPAVLLLLDAWPLGRWRSTRENPLPPRALVLEKLPLLALSLASCAVTLAAQAAGGAVRSVEAVPVLARLANAPVSYAAYLGKTVWPAGLAVHYVHPAASGAPHVAAALASAAALAGLTYAALRAASRQPYLTVGWLWYLGTLVPVIGIVQVGDQAFADRYTYLPSIGLYVAAAWGVSRLAARHRVPPGWVAAVVAVVLALLSLSTGRQIDSWKDTEALFRRALQVDPGNPTALTNLGNWLVGSGRVDEGVAYLERAVESRPDSAVALHGLGTARIRQGRPADAVELLTRAVDLRPAHVGSHVNLGHALAEVGRTAEAEVHLTRALELDPGSATAQHRLGRIRVQQRRPDDAARHLAEAVRLAPDSPEMRCDLAMALFEQGRPGQAEAELARALQIRPGYFLALHRLGIVQLEAGRPAEAERSFRAALESDPGFEPSRRSLAAVLRARGDEAAARDVEGGVIPPRSPAQGDGSPGP
jgi:Flp pilus assembly protein TadD